MTSTVFPALRSGRMLRVCFCNLDPRVVHEWRRELLHRRSPETVSLPSLPETGALESRLAATPERADALESRCAMEAS